MITVGIDLAINNIGMCRYDGKKFTDFKLLTRKKTKYKDKENVIRLTKEGFDKYLEIREQVMELCRHWGADLVLIEDFSYGSRGQAMFDLGMVQGVVRASLMDNGIDFDVVAPSKVKKGITGKGNASKMKVTMAVCRKLSIDFPDRFDDESKDVCDSIAVVWAYLGLKESEVTRSKL